MKITIVGMGIIGSAVRKSAEQQDIKVSYVDPQVSGAITLVEALEERPDAIFLCLPTPSRPDGTCDVSILESVLSCLVGFSLPVISHSTAPWALYEYWQYRVPGLVHVPEFVTAADAGAEYASQSRLIIGGYGTAPANAEQVMRMLLPGTVDVVHMRIGESSFLKYMANSFLAMKVVFANQMHDLSNSSGFDWKYIREAAKLDPRLGNSHWSVPGPDGSRGFGGMCFPKDLDAMLAQSDHLGVGLSLLEETKKANARLRR